MMRSLGLQASQVELQEMMTEADEDGSGQYNNDDDDDDDGSGRLIRSGGEVISGFWSEVFNLINSGSIEFEEFLNMMRRKMKENENSMDDVKAAFKVFDQNGDG